MKLTFSVETKISSSVRARQVSAMFDVPPAKKCKLDYDIDFPIEDAPWTVGLIVGPSGSGKTTVMRRAFGEPVELAWGAPSVLDDFASTLSIEDISSACSAVGFNTIPAWLRPYAVLSNGEKFRIDLARRLLEVPDVVVVDEFTSVVDRQVAQIGSHAVQKHARRVGKKFVAVGCHYDVIEHLNPDWVLDMATRSFTRRLLQRRPPLDCTIARVPRAAWRLFAPYHYLTGEIHAARCFGLFADGTLAAFAAVLHRPHPKVDDIKAVQRLVTLPDWQGIGLAMALVDELGGAYRAQHVRLRTYPAHPALVRAFDRSKNWRMTKAPGAMNSRTRSAAQGGTSTLGAAGMGSRPCATFEYCGAALDPVDAQRIIAT